MKIYIKPLCRICLKKLYFESVTKRRHKNYIFYEGKYYCNRCFNKKFRELIIK